MARHFIEDRLEAVLCVAWPWLFMAGFVLATLVTPYGLIVVALAAGDAALLLRRVVRRLEPTNRRVLRLWLTYPAQYQAWRYLLGKSTPGTSH
jgi:hypothetical protein